MKKQKQAKHIIKLRHVHSNLYKTVAENFKYYVDNLSQTDLDEIKADMVSSGLNSIKNVQNASEHTFVPRAKLPLEVNRRIEHGYMKGLEVVIRMEQFVLNF